MTRTDRHGDDPVEPLDADADAEAGAGAGDRPASPALAAWLDAELGPTATGWALRPLVGGNSNETALLSGAPSPSGTTRLFVARRPPRHALSASAHNLAREHRVLAALAELRPVPVPVPAPLARCEDPDVPEAPLLVMEHVPDAVSLTDRLPPRWGLPPAVAAATVADAVIDVLAAVHTLDWRGAGLGDFGRPDGFHERQVRRWYGQWERIAPRPLPAMDALADWLARRRPTDHPVGLLHGDFHVDNCLFSSVAPRLLAVIDWEMATVGDPLLDLGLLVAFWGERPVEHPGMSRLQAFSREPGAPGRGHLVARYERAVGRPVGDVDFYRVLALFKLAAIVEGAYAQYRTGDLDTPYAAALADDVPALLDEACAVAGVSARAR